MRMLRLFGLSYLRDTEFRWWCWSEGVEDDVSFL